MVFSLPSCLTPTMPESSSDYRDMHFKPQCVCSMTYLWGSTWLPCAWEGSWLLINVCMHACSVQHMCRHACVCMTASETPKNRKGMSVSAQLIIWLQRYNQDLFFLFRRRWMSRVVFIFSNIHSFIHRWLVKSFSCFTTVTFSLHWAPLNIPLIETKQSILA